MRGTKDLLEEYWRRGHCRVRSFFSKRDLEDLRAEADCLLEESPERGGARNALLRSETLRNLSASSPLAELASQALGAPARAVKLTVFDKNPAANWKVPFHQDLTITVRERKEVEGFGPWSVKGGVVNVQPPVSVLEALVALRLHLDDTGSDNGALRVIDGSHRLGRLGGLELSELVAASTVEICTAEAGDVLLMSPLLVHASSPAASPTRRRVLHFEYTARNLPGGLDWN
ncbi:MAG: phytanoyl-CoA dioxygenase family protein [Acidobacteria bacterium]|nr:phytanoyl-CoA dioxygenase family protein [Acidobacteriota bacterium]